MSDNEKFVQKGLGWFLREAWKKYPEQTEKFLLKWKDTCGRTIIQYATEKMTKEYRKNYRTLTKATMHKGRGLYQQRILVYDRNNPDLHPLSDFELGHLQGVSK